MKKRLLALVLVLLMLSACSFGGKKRYQATYLDLFDTVTVITGYASSQAEFDRTAATLHDALAEYHRLYDIYHTYAGCTNLCTLNRAAGGSTLAVDSRILDLLEFSCEMFDATGGAVNITMGSVLQLWHEARTAALDDPASAALPDWDALTEAAQHTDLSALVLDRAAGTACIIDPAVQLDVGAIAKGYATEQVARAFPELKGYLLSVGGNVRALGANQGGKNWTVGLENPFGDGLLCRVGVQDFSVVTSGSYQRCFTVDGVEYHHIISPDTLYPAQGFVSVTILSPDSGIADALSTALFILPQETGLALLQAFPDTEALWVFPDGTQVASPGFSAYRMD